MIILNRYAFDTDVDKLGSGGFSTAYKATDLHRNRTVVLKIYDKPQMTKFDILHEIQKVENIIHPNLIRYYDAFYWETTDIFGNLQKVQVGVMEYANGGNLTALFQQKIPLHQFEKIMDDVMRGLDVLHQNNILHLDLKPDNIFIHSEDGRDIIAKIGDFGISRALAQHQTALSTTMSVVAGTPDFIAPEVMLKKKYGINGMIHKNADIWSLGVIALKYFTGQGWIEHSGSTSDILEYIATELDKGIKLELDRVPNKWKRFIQLCLQPYAEKRVESIEALWQQWQKDKSVDAEPTLIWDKSSENIDKNTNADAVNKEHKENKIRTIIQQGKDIAATNLKKAVEQYNVIAKKYPEVFKPKHWLMLLGGLLVLWILKIGIYDPWQVSQAIKKIEAAGYKLNAEYFIPKVINNEIEWVKTFLKAGIDPNTKDNDGWTALMKAAENGHKEVVELLLKNGADVNAKDNDGWTALMKAAKNGHKEIVELLLKNGADVNAKDNDGGTALMGAAWWGHKEIVELLLKNGADVNAKDNDGFTMLMAAASGGLLEFAKELISNGADVNAKDNDGWTALMVAAGKGHKEIVELLLKNGADVNAKDKNGWTALRWAAENGHKEIVQLLYQYGAVDY